MNVDKLSIEPLDVDNYATWSVRMKFLLITKGLWSPVIASSEEERTESVESEAGMRVFYTGEFPYIYAKPESDDVTRKLYAASSESSLPSGNFWRLLLLFQRQVLLLCMRHNRASLNSHHTGAASNTPTQAARCD